MKNSTFDLYEKITNDMTEAMEKGIIPWSIPWVGGGPRNAVSNKLYRGINTLILGFKGYTSPYWLTMNQANTLGGSIKKGEKATYITFWKFVKLDNGVDNGGNARSKTIPILRYFLVFNVEQCENLKLPKHCETSKLDFNPIAECEKIANSYTDCPKIQTSNDGAYYSPVSDYINMPAKDTFVSSEAYYATLFHEMAHSVRSKDRLDQENLGGEKSTIHKFGDLNYSFEELVAEMTSAFLCGVAGISHVVGNNSAGYLQNWLKKFKSDKKMLIQAAGKAQKRADYIMGIKYEGGDSQGI